ncbi:preprotein translocase subunit SecA [Candidatus Uabimicrobium sp. HlEnr_7]|uniref:preprotein translocase subunit SecA n=1 Tax=Candidatus Uabimicrobium helgolandensis TaxID=3095367 RepID=UPI0035561EE8
MSFVEKLGKGIQGVFGSYNDRYIVKEVIPLVNKVNALESEWVALSDHDLKEKTTQFKKRLAEGQTLDQILPEAFATVREAARRVLNMRHYDVQLVGGIILHRGKIAEMVTGEGKTLVATSPAYLNALEGKGVFVVTVNDYLAQRDRDWMSTVYEFLGLKVGCIQSYMGPKQRQHEYGCDITYGTNNEFGFDYLRDNMKMSVEDQAQGVLNFAIIDEVDSVLIDDARTPLIISGPAEASSEKYYKAAKVVKQLKKDEDFELKEKEQLALLTDEGVEKAEKLVGVDSFYKGKNMDWPHHITQALRAKHFFKHDVEYIKLKGEIVIIDENTGRPQPGRRWSDGLHQAIEAKEGLKLREENQTLATVTLQNYFRLFNKLSGMTGTALTEAMEFHKIYSLEVFAIPTNRPLARISHDDVIYGTEREKFNAIIKEVMKNHSVGRPMLIGTISIEKSEELSSVLQARNIVHKVLNAKHHEQEAQIITNAGHLGSVTIATNMAGRGTDIVLGTFTHEELLEHWKKTGLAPKRLSVGDNNFEEKITRHWAKVYLKENVDAPLDEIQKRLQEVWDELSLPYLRLCTKISELDGLHIIGTERHDSRRIDNQLRGRSGRQGDPGSSRFFLSFEDDLMRKFAPPTMIKMMQKLGMQDGQDIQHGMINRGIEKAQKKVEGFHFEMRKSLLDYDKVMDEQRKIVYEKRSKVLKGEDLREMVWTMIEERVEDAAYSMLPERLTGNVDEFTEIRDWIKRKFNMQVSVADIDSKKIDAVIEKILDTLNKNYDSREKQLGREMMSNLEKYILLDTIDSRWKDHLYAMDVLRSSINYEAYAQIDPKVAYKKKGYEYFDKMIIAVQEDVSDFIFKLEIEEPDMEDLGDIWNPSQFNHNDLGVDFGGGGVDREAYEQAQVAASATEVKTIKRSAPKVGRNDPCPCGSGKKHKKCCGKA